MVLLLAVLVYFITYIDRTFISTAIPAAQQELLFSDAVMGSILAAHQLAYGLFQIPAGWLADSSARRSSAVPARVAASIFSTIARGNISVDMIVQSVSEHGTTDVSFTIHENDLPAATELLTPLIKEVRAAGLITKAGVAKLSVVGIGMRSHSGVAARLFDCLGRGGINIQLISTSEIKIAVIIDGQDADRAAQFTHEEFGLARLKPAPTG